MILYHSKKIGSLALPIGPYIIWFLHISCTWFHSTALLFLPLHFSHIGFLLGPWISQFSPFSGLSHCLDFPSYCSQWCMAAELDQLSMSILKFLRILPSRFQTLGRLKTPTVEIFTPWKLGCVMAGFFPEYTTFLQIRPNISSPENPSWQLHLKYGCFCCSVAKSVQPFVTPWTVARQSP